MAASCQQIYSGADANTITAICKALKYCFANTPNGAKGTAIMFSMIETAKENGLDLYKYILYILKIAPILNLDAENRTMSLLLGNTPEDCKVPS